MEKELGRERDPRGNFFRVGRKKNGGVFLSWLVGYVRFILPAR